MDWPRSETEALFPELCFQAHNGQSVLSFPDVRPGLRGKAAQDVLFVVRAVNYSVHLNQTIRALPGPVHPRMVHGLTGSPFKMIPRSIEMEPVRGGSRIRMRRGKTLPEIIPKITPEAVSDRSAVYGQRAPRTFMRGTGLNAAPVVHEIMPDAKPNHLIRMSCIEHIVSRKIHHSDFGEIGRP